MNAFGIPLPAALIVAAPLLGSLLWFQAKPSLSQAAADKPAVLVELFTSEGCSSCPPADALLGQINGTLTEQGQLIVGVSEHVTYWNQLGWSDPYSSETSTARQNAYGERFRLDSVYTPQMIINGSEQINGSDRTALLEALRKQTQGSRISLRILSSRVDDGRLTMTFSAGGISPGNDVEIMAVLADDADRSTVLRGENSGRTLAHVAVARSLARVATMRGDGEKTVQLPLPASFRHEPGAGHHLILFAQKPGLGAVLGTDTKPV